MEAVKYWNGDEYVCGKHEKYHTHIVNAVGTDRFYSAYASDIGGDSAICTISKYNQFVHSCMTNSEESSLKHLHIWQEGIKRQPETDEQFKAKLNEIDKELEGMEIDWGKAPKGATHYITDLEDGKLSEFVIKNGEDGAWLAYKSLKKGHWSKETDDNECYLVTPKPSQPVFTQAMADNGESIKAGMLFQYSSGEKTELLLPIDERGMGVAMFDGEYCIVCQSGMLPIDTRTDKEKAIDEFVSKHAIDSHVTQELLVRAYDEWVGE